jgi:undecaprenyl-phosphate 4-deoxy-4-formamido-L-arabinose transferase
MKENLSVVIPVYNSEKTLVELTQRLDNALKERCERYEVVLVNDGSRDASWRMVQELMAANPAIHGINLMRNYGQHNALLCGIRAARYETIVTMDDDLQHLPEEIGKLLDKLAEGYDVVYGIPEKLVHSLWRNLSSKMSKRFLATILGLKRLKYISAFRAFKTDLRRSFASFGGPNVIIDALLTWGTDNFGTVEVVEQQRAVGRSNYTLGKLINLGMTVLTGFSTYPLKFASFSGFFLTLFGIGVLVYAVVRSFQDGSVPGFPFLASIISIFSGAQLFALGIFGEYLGSIFHRSMNQPTYILAEDNENSATKR